VTVLVPGATKTPMVTRFGADQTSMRRMLTPVDVSVRESLAALNANRTSRIIGRMNRAMVALVPRTARTKMFGGMTKSMAERARSTTGDDAVPDKLLS
jgi:short-subunit dehydrogenase